MPHLLPVSVPGRRPPGAGRSVSPIAILLPAIRGTGLFFFTGVVTFPGFLEKFKREIRKK